MGQHSAETETVTEADPSEVDGLLDELLLPEDPVLTAALEDSAAAGLPAIAVSAQQGAFLQLIARAIGARRILEFGTLGGYSTIWMARAVGADGAVVSLEYAAHHAEVARANLERAGVGERVSVLVGPALETLPSLADEAPFDLVFIDADKENNAAYLRWALQLSRPGTVIIVDNVIRDGRVVDAEADDASRGARAVLEQMGAEPRLQVTALQTVGAKGWDGFAMALVTEE
ncbi:O-methyltransferase [Mycobacterium koreense]|uniref:Methyltransferase n=1 Tax=Mycolicibacillus koreensis TaxID=1069220 RepID=A0AA91SRE8_9MYCO|nr:O-methyltransferase [Mycolicibacillus koreensis]MCV7248691.1 O-methyltransferase [Mycolicibacillus koreensis]ODR05051.1 methyltransferase [Mycolicibacillus koreensis]OSC33382.1 methyltransferase [Mycolicibacillus koreensis]